MNIGNMTIREYAAKHDIEIVGKMKRIPDCLAAEEPWRLPWRCYVDEAGTEIDVNPRNGEIVVYGSLNCGEWVF